MGSPHSCYACAPGNAERIFVCEGDVLTATVPARFVGPPGQANGGIATGMLACPALRSAHAGGAAHAAVTRITARIGAGVPVGAPLRVHAEPAGGSGEADAAYDVTIADGAAPLVSGRVEMAFLDAPPAPGQVLAGAPPERADEVAALAALAVPDRPVFWEDTGEHPLPRCFSCGPDAERGLRVFPRIASDGVTCASWQPESRFNDGGGSLSSVIVAAALDCSSGICMPAALQRELLDQDAFFLLGSLDVRFLRAAPVAAPAPYRVAAKALLRDGRKFFGMSVLAGGDGTAYAVAEAVWIVAGVTRTVAFGPH